MDRIKEIEERVSKASKGNWFVMHDTDIMIESPPGSGELDVVCWMNNIHNANFVGNAKSDIQYLLAENKRLKEALDRIQNRAVTYKNNEPTMVVLSDIAAIAGRATNVFIHDKQIALREEGNQK